MKKLNFHIGECTSLLPIGFTINVREVGLLGENWTIYNKHENYVHKSNLTYSTKDPDIDDGLTIKAIHEFDGELYYGFHFFEEYVDTPNTSYLIIPVKRLAEYAHKYNTTLREQQLT